MKPSAALLIMIFLLTPGLPLVFSYSEEPVSLKEGIASLAVEADELIGSLGRGCVEIEPGAFGSRADRIVYHPRGITLWIYRGRTEQIRLDSNWDGLFAGVNPGASMEDVLRTFGNPWIEEASSLYYNLPWQEGAVRLRFTFREKKLDQIYLFRVF